MGYDVVELIPAPHDYFDRDGPLAPAAPSAPSTSAVLAIVYYQRAAFYERQLVEEYRRIRYGGNSRGTEHPRCTVKLPGQELVIVFDSTLDTQLLQIYVYYGWSGIEAAANAMIAASKSPASGRLHPWRVVASFFDFARNRLALGIQDSLVDIEAACADHVMSQLSAAASTVNESWAMLAFAETDISPEGAREPRMSPSLDTPSREFKKFWKAGNRDLASRLFEAVGRAVQGQDDLRVQQERRDRLRAAVQNFDDGPPPTSTTKDLEEQERAIEVALPGLEQLYEDVHRLVPLATLVVPMLQTPVKQAQMEHLLGTALAQFRAHGERLGRGINEGRNYLRALFGAWDVSKRARR